MQGTARALAAASLLALTPGAASAHSKSLSWSIWTVDGTDVRLYVEVAAIDVVESVPIDSDGDQRLTSIEAEAGRGLTGEAKLTSKDIGIDWTAAPFVTSLDGDATVLFERGGLVAGSSQLVATCTFGTVGIRVTDIGTAGI